MQPNAKHILCSASGYDIPKDQQSQKLSSSNDTFQWFQIKEKMPLMNNFFRSRKYLIQFKDLDNLFLVTGGMLVFCIIFGKTIIVSF